MWSNIKKTDDGGIPPHYSIKGEQSDRYNLFLGLGGLGIKTLGKIKKEICFRIRENEFAEYDRISFLAIDTHGKELNRLRDIYGFTDDERMLISPRTLLFMKGKPEWISEDAYLHNYEDLGVGMYRQIGRACLFVHIEKLYNRLETVLLRAASFHSEIDIHIITGLAGGTGSGSFLDICYLIRNIIRKNGITKCTVYGYCFMPDLQLSMCSQLFSQQGKCMLENSYAALKEIHYFMNQRIPHHFSEKYSESIFVDSINPPVDYVRFVSSYFPDNSIMSNEQTIDNLVGMIVESFVWKHGCRYGKGWTSNNSKFVIGYVSGCNPNIVDENTFHISNLYCGMISKLSENISVRGDDIEQIIHECGNALQSIKYGLARGIEAPTAPIGIIGTDNYINKWINETEQIIAVNSLHVRETMSEILKKSYIEIIRDVNHGIFFVSRLLSEHHIQNYIDERVHETIRRQHYTSEKLTQIKESLFEVERELCNSGIFKRKKLLAEQEFLLADFYEALKEKLVLMKVRSLMENLLDQVSNLLHQTVFYKQFMYNLKYECESNLIYYQNRNYDMDSMVNLDYEHVLKGVMDILLDSDKSDDNTIKMKVLSVLAREVVSSLSPHARHLIDYTGEYDLDSYVFIPEMKDCYNRGNQCLLHLNKRWGELIPDL